MVIHEIPFTLKDDLSSLEGWSHIFNEILCQIRLLEILLPPCGLLFLSSLLYLLRSSSRER